MTDIVFQGEPLECGLACLSSVSKILGKDLNISLFRNQVKSSALGVSLNDLSNLADNYNLLHDIIKFSGDDIKNISCPAIIHLSNNHYVVLKEVSSLYAIILNPAMGKQIVPIDLLKNMVSGYGLSFHCNNVARHNNINVDVDVKIISYSALVIIISTLLPLLIYTISEIKLSLMLALFIILSLQVIYFLSVRMQFKSKLDMEINNFKKFGLETYTGLIKNKLDFFEKRIASDVKEKFEAYCAATSLNKILTSEAIVSLLASILSIVIALSINIRLTIITLSAVVISGIATFFFKVKIEEFYSRYQESSVMFSRYLLQTILGYSTIKSSGKQRVFTGLFNSRSEELITEKRNVSTLEFYYSSITTIIFNIEFFLILTLSYYLVDAKELALSTFLAYLFIRQIVIGSITTTYEMFILQSKVAIDKARGEDIISYEKHDLSYEMTKSIGALIHAVNIGYKFNGNDNNTVYLKDLTIIKNSILSIYGPSGSGKSTILKLISGHYCSEHATFTDSSGSLETKTLRGLCYLSTPDDVIFDGSIIDNVTLFDSEPDIMAVQKILETIGLMDMINTLPLGMEHLIQDEVNPFSYGQKKRLLLCRAFYSNKELVLLDEPTSNLDDESASKVISLILESNKTVVIATHDKNIKSISDYSIKI